MKPVLDEPKNPLLLSSGPIVGSVAVGVVVEGGLVVVVLVLLPGVVVAVVGLAVLTSPAPPVLLLPSGSSVSVPLPASTAGPQPNVRPKARPRVMQAIRFMERSLAAHGTNSTFPRFFRS